MRLQIGHRTRYRYSGGVSLDRHLLRVLPRFDPRQRLLDHRPDIEPPPARRGEFPDAWGNSASVLWFDGDTDRLEIDVETGRRESSTASGFAEVPNHPLSYGSEQAALEDEELMADFTSDLLAQSRGRVFPLLWEGSPCLASAMPRKWTRMPKLLARRNTLGRKVPRHRASTRAGGPVSA